jgi:hypothetical protein
MSYVIGRQKFDSKACAAIYFAALKACYRVGEKITDHDGKVLYELIRKHPNSAEKIGSGVKHFTVTQGAFGSTCFGAIRNDGTIAKFSVKACLHGKGKSLKAMFNDSARLAVSVDIARVKASLISLNGCVCSITKQKLHSKYLQVDHMAPKTFKTIVDDFMQSENFSLSKEMFARDESNLLCFSDHALSERFRSFHRHSSAGHLRLISKFVHRGLTEELSSFFSSAPQVTNGSNHEKEN